MIKIATLFGSFEGKNRASAIDEYVEFHASKEKPLPKIKSIIEDGDNLDEAEIQDYQEEAQEAWIITWEIQPTTVTMKDTLILEMKLSH